MAQNPWSFARPGRASCPLDSVSFKGAWVKRVLPVFRSPRTCHSSGRTLPPRSDTPQPSPFGRTFTCSRYGPVTSAFTLPARPPAHTPDGGARPLTFTRLLPIRGCPLPVRPRTDPPSRPVARPEFRFGRPGLVPRPPGAVGLARQHRRVRRRGGVRVLGLPEQVEGELGAPLLELSRRLLPARLPLDQPADLPVADLVVEEDPPGQPQLVRVLHVPEFDRLVDPPGAGRDELDRPVLLPPGLAEGRVELV